MRIEPSGRIQQLETYPFAILEQKAAQLRSAGVHIIDLGVGSPVAGVSEVVRKATRDAVNARAFCGYPTYEGSMEFREAAASWIYQRFGVRLDPETEITACAGTKEAIFHLPLGLLNPGDLALVPSPGYAPYERGTFFAAGKPHIVPLSPEHNFLIDLIAIPSEVAETARLFWINYPNNPTAATADAQFLQQMIEFGRKHNTIICSDEAYIDLYYDSPPHSILEFADEGVLALFSLSKSASMASYRVGFIAGDAKIIELFRKVKTNIDAGVPHIIQDAAIAALRDEDYTQRIRAEYKQKRDILVEGLRAAGLEVTPPSATFYMWQRVPAGRSSLEFAERLLEPDVGIVAMPGAWLAQPLPDGSNPGASFIRFAFVAPVNEIQLAAERIAHLSL